MEVQKMETEKESKGEVLAGILVEQLSEFAGDGGESEGAAECLKRLLAELRQYRKEAKLPDMPMELTKDFLVKLRDAADELAARSKRHEGSFAVTALALGHAADHLHAAMVRRENEIIVVEPDGTIDPPPPPADEPLRKP